MKSVYKNIWETAKSSEVSMVMPCTKLGKSYGSSIFCSFILFLIYYSFSSTPIPFKHPCILPSFYPCIPLWPGHVFFHFSCSMENQESLMQGRHKGHPSPITTSAKEVAQLFLQREVRLIYIIMSPDIHLMIKGSPIYLI